MAGPGAGQWAGQRPRARFSSTKRAGGSCCLSKRCGVGSGAVAVGFRGPDTAMDLLAEAPWEPATLFPRSPLEPLQTTVVSAKLRPPENWGPVSGDRKHHIRALPGKVDSVHELTPLVFREQCGLSVSTGESPLPPQSQGWFHRSGQRNRSDSLPSGNPLRQDPDLVFCRTEKASMPDAFHDQDAAGERCGRG